MDKPVLGKDDVLIRVSYVSLCGSDRHLFKGELSGQAYPIIPGHEFSGVITDAPRDQKGLIGKKCIADIMIPCGACKECKAGHESECKSRKEIGFKLDGALAKYIKVPVKSLYLLESSFDLKNACMVEPVAVALQVEKDLHPKKSDRILILGAGSIGLSLAHVLRGKGYGTITLADRNWHKLRIAEKAFSVECLDLSVAGLKEHYCNKARPNIIVETTGSRKLIEDSFGIAVFGASIGIVGFIQEHIMIDPSIILLNGLTVKGVIGPKGVWEEAIAIVTRSDTFCRMMITDEQEFSETDKAFHDFIIKRNDGSIKTIIRMGKE
ncbi:MAG: alcohol dehydrogenase catalytic domain-containing protein [Nanoarchaeota archaeon]